MEELNSLITALNNLERSASFAQKYGPYFFAVALLVVTPFVCRTLFSRSMDNAADSTIRRRAYEDFRFYFRSTVALGIFCVIAGVGWWLYESYRENARTTEVVAELKKKLVDVEKLRKDMNYTASGLISSGLGPKDEFHLTLVNHQFSIVFAKMPVGHAWFFVVTSDKELPPAIDINVAWSQHSDDATAPPVILTIPIQLVVKKRFGDTYKFSFEGSHGKLQPIN